MNALNPKIQKTMLDGLQPVLPAQRVIPAQAGIQTVIPALILLAIVLSGCAQAPVDSRITPSWDARRDELMRLESWDLKGRIAVRTQNESGSGSLLWAQRRDMFDIRVIAPLSGRTYELSGAAGSVTLRTPDRNTVQAEDAETLLRQAEGWYFPVSELIYWIRGLPAPVLKVDQMQLDEEDRVSTLNQGGWSIRYRNYLRIGETSMPGRMDLENEHVRVRLSVREWNLP